MWHPMKPWIAALRYYESMQEHRNYRIIAIDCDDVLVGTAPLTIDYYNKTYGTKLTLEDMYSDDPKRWDTDRATAIARVERYLETDEFRTAPPFRDAISTIRELAKRYELHMVTGRTQLLETATKDMLEKHFPKLFRSLEFTGLYGDRPRSKSDVCKQLKADLLIDDHLGHALPVAACGVDVLLFGEYPWNRTTEKLPANVRRVKGWEQVSAVLLGS